MKTTLLQFTLTALAYIIPTMVLGMAWHFIFFPDLYKEMGIYNRTEPIIPLGFASMIIQGIIIAYFYPYYARDNRSIGKVIAFSLLMGLFLYSVSTLANAAKIHVSSMASWLGVQLGFHTLQFLVAGILIALVDKLFRPKNN